MINVNVSISGIIMCCDESLCGLNLGRGYTIEKCNLGSEYCCSLRPSRRPAKDDSKGR